MKCNNCGTINDKDAVYCGNCGEVVIVGKKICFNCKNSVDLNVDYCPHCEAFIKKGFSECKKCGKINSLEFKYCTRCKKKNINYDIASIKRLGLITLGYVLVTISGFLSSFIVRNVAFDNYVSGEYITRYFDVNIRDSYFYETFMIGSILNFIWITIVIGFTFYILFSVRRNEMKLMSKANRILLNVTYLMLFMSISGSVILSGMLVSGGYQIKYLGYYYHTWSHNPNDLEILCLILHIVLSLYLIVIAFAKLIKNRISN